MILAILQARMSSKRLPGKVLKHICNVPVLALQIERLLRCDKFDKLIVATSVEGSDDPIEQLCQSLKLDCFRGNLNDVLSRFVEATNKYKADHIVRLTGDCPLADHKLIDQVIDLHMTESFDYTTNVFPRTFPDGLDVEVLTKELLFSINQKATNKEDREHVTYYIEKRLEQIKLGNISQLHDYSALRWTLDTAEDFQLITKIYEALYKKNPLFTTQDILDYLEI